MKIRRFLIVLLLLITANSIKSQLYLDFGYKYAVGMKDDKKHTLGDLGVAFSNENYNGPEFHLSWCHCSQLSVSFLSNKGMMLLNTDNLSFHGDSLSFISNMGQRGYRKIRLPVIYTRRFSISKSTEFHVDGGGFVSFFKWKSLAYQPIKSRNDYQYEFTSNVIDENRTQLGVHLSIGIEQHVLDIGAFYIKASYNQSFTKSQQFNISYEEKFNNYDSSGDYINSTTNGKSSTFKSFNTNLFIEFGFKSCGLKLRD